MLTFSRSTASGMFQSSPVTKDGRYDGGEDVGYFLRCFNPRPSLRTGATGGEGGHAPNSPCFNPRPSLRTGATS